MPESLTNYIWSIYKDQSQENLLSSYDTSSSIFIILLIFFIGMIILSFSLTIVFLVIKLYNCHECGADEKDEEAMIGEKDPSIMDVNEVNEMNEVNEVQKPRDSIVTKSGVIIDVIHDDVYHEVNN